MKKIMSSVVLIGASVLVAACGAGSKISPDEFKVVSKPPLSIPPEYNKRPPLPGQPSAEDVSVATRAVGVLFPGQTTVPVPPSQSEQNLLIRSGALRADPDIRSTVSDKKTSVVEKGTLISNILTMDDRNDMPDTSKVTRVSSKPVKQ